MDDVCACGNCLYPDKGEDELICHNCGDAFPASSGITVQGATASVCGKCLDGARVIKVVMRLVNRQWQYEQYSPVEMIKQASHSDERP